MENLVKVFKALSDETRLNILLLVSKVLRYIRFSSITTYKSFKGS